MRRTGKSNNKKINSEFCVRFDMLPGLNAVADLTGVTM
jgi:hypothetical protein